MPSLTAYLAGPDVFLPNAAANAAAKIAICAKYGIMGRPPLDDDTIKNLPPNAAWRTIYLKNLEIMEGCGIVIANLTPFRGASADAGTLVEIGWFAGRGRGVFGYSNSALNFAERSARQLAASPDPLPDLILEGFGLPDNLMIPGVLEYAGGRPLVTPADGISRAFDALDVFEACVAAAAAALKTRPMGEI